MSKFDLTVIEIMNNIARHNLVNTKYCQMTFKLLDGTVVKSCLGTLGQTMVFCCIVAWRFSCCLKMKSVEKILGYIREQFYRFSRYVQHSTKVIGDHQRKIAWSLLFSSWIFPYFFLFFLDLKQRMSTFTGLCINLVF